MGDGANDLPMNRHALPAGRGLAVSPVGLGLLGVEPLDDAILIERVTEIAVLISLFTVGPEAGACRCATGAGACRCGWPRSRWSLTVAAIAGVGRLALGLSLGAAVLLGAILAPTDPVLASDVQVATRATATGCASA